MTGKTARDRLFARNILILNPDSITEQTAEHLLSEIEKVEEEIRALQAPAVGNK